MDRQIRNQEGAVAIMVALVLFLLCGTAALAIDIGHLMVVRNELRNASDAGTLAGARFLYSEDGRTHQPRRQPDRPRRGGRPTRARTPRWR